MSYDPIKWGANDMARLPRRTRTRWLILGAMAALTILPIVELIAPGDPDRFFSPVVNAMLPLLIVTYYSPFAAHSWWLGSPALAAADEFHVAVMGRASRLAHLSTMGLVGLIFGWLALARWFGWPVPTLSRQWVAIGLSLLAIVSGLPILFAEFLVPVPSDNEQWEDA